jgi:indole-3-glycerol phosphate synthase
VSDVLAAIVAATRRDLEVRKATVPVSALAARARDLPPPRGRQFAGALVDAGGVNVIAECKRRSPSRGVLRRHYDAVAQALAYERGGAAAISVLTEPSFFDGALAHLDAVRRAVSVPLLRKDFLVDQYQLVEAWTHGADAVLLIVSALEDAALTLLHRAASDLGLAVLVEVHDEEELRRAVDAGAAIVGVNNRNLRTLAVDAATSERIARALPPGVTAVSESGLSRAGDVARLRAMGYSAFLVGERLMAAPDPEAVLRALRGQEAPA